MKHLEEVRKLEKALQEARAALDDYVYSHKSELVEEMSTIDPNVHNIEVYGNFGHFSVFGKVTTKFGERTVEYKTDYSRVSKQYETKFWYCREDVI